MTKETMVAVVVSGLETLKETFLDWSWPPAVSITRNAVLRTFSALEVGSILIIDQPSGIEHAFGKSSSKDKEADVRNSNTIPNVEIVVKRDSFWLRLFLYADMGFAEGYMLDDFECNDLTSFFRVCFLVSILYLRCQSETQLTYGIPCSYSS